LPIRKFCQYNSKVIFAVILVLIFFVVYLTFAIQGAPYVPSDDKSATQMLRLIKEIKPKYILDMGSGDGKMVILLAKAGYRIDGVELNPWLVYKSRRAIEQAGLSNMAFIKWGNLWKFNTANYDTVLLYAISHIMPKLEKKLTAELSPGSYIVSNYFVFPNLKPFKQIGRARVYKI
jgi:ribosomal protein L11 methylase PrmA